MTTLTPANQSKYSGWFFLTMAMFFIHYVRPQTLIPGISPILIAIKPFMLVMMAVAGCIMLSPYRNKILLWHIKPIKYSWLIILIGILLLPITAGKKDAIDVIIMILTYMPFVISIQFLVTTQERLKVLIDVLIFSAGILAIRGLFFTHTGFGKGSSFELGNFLSDPNDCALYMNMMLPFCIFRAFSEFSKVRKLVYFSIAAIVFTVIVYSLSRGGFIALLFTFSIMVYYSPYRKRLITYGTLCTIASIIIAGPMLTTTYGSSLNTGESTAQRRFSLWTGSLKVFVRNPLGVGFKGVGKVTHKYSTDGKRDWGMVNHSTWLTALAEWGIVGFIVYLLLLRVNFKSMVSLSKTSKDPFIRNMAIAALCSLVAYMIAGSFLTGNYYPHLWYLTAIICALYYVGTQTKNNSVLSQRRVV